MKKRILLSLLYFLKCFAILSTNAQSTPAQTDVMYRPAIHFTPKQHWMNDPNGMVFHNGIYHLFFQYHPFSSVWGPMHWGHATSKDLVSWEEQPIAIYPDSIGTIFSGSAVVDQRNSSGFGTKGKPALVAIYTQHNMEGEKAGKNNFQNQSIAYSNNDGKTWTKYAGNPVLKNPGITDFRDPKVMWHAGSKKWVMTLATKDKISFYTSANLKQWQFASSFGEQAGAHGGVWECPDLIAFTQNGKTVWALIVNLNPGAPNGGSGTQYFLGNFDGKKFTAMDTATRWLDYGPDNYAGITFSNTGNRKIFLGWMSNWQYATVVPTTTWRSTMTVARTLQLKYVNNKPFLTSMPVEELFKKRIEEKQYAKSDKPFEKFRLKLPGVGAAPYMVDLVANAEANTKLVLNNDLGEQVIIGFDVAANQYYIDRKQAGNVSFEKGFAARHTAPRFSNDPLLKMTLVVDATSVELFADDGFTVMTAIFFPTKPFNDLQGEGARNNLLSFKYFKLIP